MEIGVRIPHTGAHATPQFVREWCTVAEQAGFASLWGVDHLVMVTCDEDCFDVNLRVFDASGKLVGEDVSPPAVDNRFLLAKVQVIPETTQTFRLEVEAYCREGSIGNCSYAVGINTK